MPSDWLWLALGLVLVAGTALFVAAEFSLVALDPAVVDDGPTAPAGTRAARRQARRAASIRAALASLSTQLSGAQIGITVTTVLLGYTTQPALARLLASAFGRIGWMSASAGATVAVVCAIVLVNAGSMIFGELVPKNAALASPLRTAGLVVGAQRAVTVVVGPAVRVLSGAANGILRLAKVTPTEALSSARSARELSALVRHSAAAGTLDQALAARLTRSLALEELRAIDIMTDRTRLVSLDRQACAADVVAAARTSGYSHFPVTEGSIDDIIGIVHLRRAVAVPYARRADVPVAALMVDAPRVPETAPVNDLLPGLRAPGGQMAIVVDEYGGTSGVLTLEDVVEEIIGDVADEHDVRRPGPRRLREGSWRVPGQLRPDELRQRAGIALPEGAAYETLGGLVMARLGRIPVAGDEVEVAGVRLRVERMSGRRVEVLQLWPPTGGGEAE